MSLRRHLKHWLVPHRHNDHRPHLIRGHGLVVVLLLIIGLQAGWQATRPVAVRVLSYASNITPLDLFNATNRERAAAGLPALQLDARLNSSAQMKAQNMFAENYWAHVSPSGIQPWHWFELAGYPYTYAGENLAKDFDTTAGTMEGWMNSPGHRANILNPNYRDVGFAVMNGTLVGGETTLVVAHYGVTSTAPVVAATTPAAPVAAPAATPVATPTLTPSPVPAATPVVSQQPVLAASQTLGPAPKSYSLFRPLAVTRTLNWPALVTLLLLLLLLVVYLATHAVVWRKGLRRWRSRPYRWLAAGEVATLVALITWLGISGFGRVG